MNESNKYIIEGSIGSHEKNESDCECDLRNKRERVKVAYSFKRSLEEKYGEN